MSSFIEMVKLGTTSPDNEVRKQNEDRLLNYRQKDPDAFLQDCMVTFMSDDTDVVLKQAIGTIVKISFASENVKDCD